MQKQFLAALVTMSSAVAVPLSPSIGAIVSGSATASGGGGFAIITAPTTVDGGNTGSPPTPSVNVQAFSEQQAFVLTSALTVGGVLLGAGTTISSYYVNYFPNTLPNVTAKAASGTITFDAPILAIASTTGDLAATDIFGNPGTTYGGAYSARGLETGDFATFTGDEVNFSVAVSYPGDSFRVLTAQTTQAAQAPEPASWAMMIVGFGAIGAAMRRRKLAVDFA